MLNTNIAVITFDALRWDVTHTAKTPELKKLFNHTNTKWNKVYAHGTFTLPSHIAIFQNGQLPSNEFDDNVPDEYTRRNNMFRWFQVTLPWKEKMRSCRFELPETQNLVKSFEKLGYNTIGVGGVSWFSTEVETTNIWNHYFKTFYWRKDFQERQFDALEKQIELIQRIDLSPPLFFFLNISATHIPCRGNESTRGQADALDYIDANIMEVIEALPKPLTLFLLSDHGTLFQEDEAGLTGHGFYHPKVMEIPMNVLNLQ